MARETSDTEVEKIAQILLQKMERLKEDALGRRRRFESLTKEQLVKKIRGKLSKSPYFYWLSYEDDPEPGDVITFETSIYKS